MLPPKSHQVEMGQAQAWLWWWFSEIDCMSVLLSLLCTNQGWGIVIRGLKDLAWLDFTFNSFKHTDSQSTWYSLSVAGDMVGNTQNLHFSLNQHLLPYSHLVYMPSWLRISTCPILSPAIGVWRKEDGPNPTGHKCIECAFVSPSLYPLSLAISLSLSLFLCLSFLPSENCFPTQLKPKYTMEYYRECLIRPFKTLLFEP